MQQHVGMHLGDIMMATLLIGLLLF